jgi:hypothetical protein
MTRDYEVDLGLRCDRHVGEVFPPRCSACDVEAVKAAADESARRLESGGYPAYANRAIPASIGGEL